MTRTQAIIEELEHGPVSVTTDEADAVLRAKGVPPVVSLPRVAGRCLLHRVVSPSGMRPFLFGYGTRAEESENLWLGDSDEELREELFLMQQERDRYRALAGLDAAAV